MSSKAWSKKIRPVPMTETRQQSRALNKERTIWIVLVILAFVVGLSQGGRFNGGEDPHQAMQDRDPLFGQ